MFKITLKPQLPADRISLMILCKLMSSMSPSEATPLKLKGLQFKISFHVMKDEIRSSSYYNKLACMPCTHIYSRKESRRRSLFCCVDTFYFIQ
uniref:CSON006562 protein n=1 Tax=Culicoides sonorensis TaxID=179676 RepID=A0A336LBD9_CULSO